jgi:hypothetical protein
MMQKLTDLLKGPQTAVSNVLTFLKLSNQQAEMIKLFTEYFTRCFLHYEEDEQMRGYSHCLGTECPYCVVGAKPSENCLLPVYSVGLDAVVAMKLSAKQGPQQLITQIGHHLMDPELEKKILTIERVDNFHHKVTAKKEDHYSTVGVAAIRSFLEREEGADLKALFPTHSAEDILTIKDVRRRWDLIRGLSHGDRQ